MIHVNLCRTDEEDSENMDDGSFELKHLKVHMQQILFEKVLLPLNTFLTHPPW